MLCTLEQKRVRGRRVGRIKLLYDCALSHIALMYQLHFFLKLILEQIYLIATILSSLPLSLLYPLGEKTFNSWKGLLISSSMIWRKFSAMCQTTVVCLFLAAAFEKTNSIELYTLYILELWIYDPSNTVQLVLKHFSWLFHRLSSAGRENSMKWWSFQFPLLMCR